MWNWLKSLTGNGFSSLNINLLLSMLCLSITWFFISILTPDSQEIKKHVRKITICWNLAASRGWTKMLPLGHNFIPTFRVNQPSRVVLSVTFGQIKGGITYSGRILFSAKEQLVFPFISCIPGVWQALLQVPRVQRWLTYCPCSQKLL